MITGILKQTWKRYYSIGEAGFISGHRGIKHADLALPGDASDMVVVAEGVEDESTMRRVASLGCEQAQGYFFKKPVAADDFLAWLIDFEPIIFHERRDSGRAFAS